jgi:hypothetical protein
MTEETRPGGSALSGDPHQILATLRPQAYGDGAPQKVRDPLIEPLWTGVRTLAAIDDSGTTLIDGFLTKQTAHAASVVVWPDEMPSVGRLVGLRRNRAIDTMTLKEETLAAHTFESEEAVSFVATDLLWLDDTSLLDVPLLERRRLLESVLVESDVVRVGAFIRPPIESWVSSWRSVGFSGLTYKAANSRYLPGQPNPDWVITGMPRR